MGREEPPTNLSEHSDARRIESPMPETEPEPEPAATEVDDD